MKTCSKCGNEYPLTSEFWYKDKTRPDGYQYICKSCSQKQDKDRYDPEKNSEKGRKYRQENPEKLRETNRKYRQSNLKKFREYSAKWREDHIEEVREYARERIRQNPEKHRDNSRRYRRENPEKYKETNRNWRRSNPERARAIIRKYRARKMKAEGSHTGDQIKALFEQQEGKCFHCGADISQGYHADHWIPLSRGGSNNIDNIRLLCPYCNLSKNDQLPSEWQPSIYPPT